MCFVNQNYDAGRCGVKHARSVKTFPLRIKSKARDTHDRCMNKNQEKIASKISFYFNN